MSALQDVLQVFQLPPSGKKTQYTTVSVVMVVITTKWTQDETMTSQQTK